MSEMISSYPKQIEYIINCGDLHHLYNKYLKPYLGENKYFFEHDKSLMGELYCRLEYGETYEGHKPISDILNEENDIHIPSDIKNYFFDELYTLINNLIRRFDSMFKGKMIVEINMREGYMLRVLTAEYTYEENNYVELSY